MPEREEPDWDEIAELVAAGVRSFGRYIEGLGEALAAAAELLQKERTKDDYALAPPKDGGQSE